MKKYRKLNLGKLSIANLREVEKVKGGTDPATTNCQTPKTRTQICGGSCGGQLSIFNAGC